MTTSVSHAYPVNEFLQGQPNLNCSFIRMLRKMYITKGVADEKNQR
jgi:hypothetical protein